MGAEQELRGQRWRTRAHLEVGDGDFASREGAVDRRQIRNQQRQDAQADARLGECDEGRRHVGRPLESEREKGRAAGYERAAPAVVLDALKDRRIRGEDDEQGNCRERKE